jgi:predicted small metal-binding protein
MTAEPFDEIGHVPDKPRIAPAARYHPSNVRNIRPERCRCRLRFWDTMHSIGLVGGLQAGRSAMARKFVDCREFPSEMKCTIAISADSEAEVLDAAVQHAVSVHRHKDSPKLRVQLKGAIKNGSPR